jgi:hypothetical protein
MEEYSSELEAGRQIICRPAPVFVTLLSSLHVSNKTHTSLPPVGYPADMVAIACPYYGQTKPVNRYGTTTSGSSRCFCRVCKKAFTLNPKPTTLTAGSTNLPSVAIKNAPAFGVSDGSWIAVPTPSTPFSKK